VKTIKVILVVVLLVVLVGCEHPSVGPDGRCHQHATRSDIDCPCVDEARVVPAGKTGGAICHPLAAMKVEFMASAGVAQERTAAKPDLGRSVVLVCSCPVAP